MKTQKCKQCGQFWVMVGYGWSAIPLPNCNCSNESWRNKIKKIGK